MAARPRSARYPFSRLMRGLWRGWEGRLALSLDIAARADVVRLPVPGRPTFFLTHPDDFKHVLQVERERYIKSYDYRVLRQLMGDGLVTSEDPRWRTDRRLLQPSFTKAAVADLADAMRAEVERLTARWAGPGAPAAIDPFGEMMRLTIAVVGRRLLSQDLSEDAERIHTLIDRCARHVVGRAQAPVDVNRFVRTPAARRAQAARAELVEILERYLSPRWPGPGGDAPDVASVLHGDGRTRAEAIDHLITLFAAGYDTTGNALGWCLTTLASHPALQDELAAEVRSPASGEAALGALVQETLRCYPTVPGVGREAVVDDDLDGVRIPKGATLFLFFYGLHHRADEWTDPAAFRPDRFRHDRGVVVPYRSYQPFGMGPRICIGSHFALQEMTTALGGLLPRFRFALPPGETPPPPVPGISLSPARPVRLRASLR